MAYGILGAEFWQDFVEIFQSDEKSVSQLNDLKIPP
jgi:hypothetical protein